MTTSLSKRWRKFVNTDPRTFTREELEQAVMDASSSDWNACPIAALVPDVCEEFRAISKRLAALRCEDLSKWSQAFEITRPLFRAGCTFGDAVERLAWATSEEDKLSAYTWVRIAWVGIMHHARKEA